MPLNLNPYHIRLGGHASEEDFKKHIASQVNNALKLIQRTAPGSQTTTVQAAQQAATAGSTGATSGKEITVTTQSLSAGVATPITFAFPALLVGLPDCYATQDNLFTIIGYSITVNEPTGFSITALADCQVKFGYQAL